MLRITGGEFRGRGIQAPTGDRTRPTQAKLRQALFNSIQAFIPDSVVLDLFAGSGSLGFEALSRGAQKVIFVESARSVAQLIEKNARTLGVQDRIEIVQDTMDNAWKKIAHHAPFDLIFADPPYAGGWEMKLIQSAPWTELLKEDSRFCLEWGTQKSQVQELPDETAFLVKVREKTYGDSVLTTYRPAERSP